MSTTNIDRSLVTDLSARWDDEEMSDVMLIGSDGVTVPAVRFMLGCRSAVFRKMLYGNFKEATSKEVVLNYPAAVLRAVVEYCCTDSTTQFSECCDEESARDLVQLNASAHFFELPELQNQSYDMSCALMEQSPSLACTFFDEVFSTDKTVVARLHSFALSLIRRKPKSCLLPDENTCGGVISLHQEALGAIVCDEKIMAKELTIFKALKTWADHFDSRAVSPQDHRDCETVGVVKDYIRRIDLSRIDPPDLVGYVEQSGLVGSDLISQALRKQAIRAYDEGIEFSTYRCEPKGTLAKVQVAGAGTRAVNGMYTQDGYYEGVAKYSKLGQWEGREVMFYLWRYNGTDWYISFIPDGRPLIDRTEVDCYKGIGEADRENSVPTKRWKAIDKGTNPTPTCKWIAPVESDSLSSD